MSLSQIKSISVAAEMLVEECEVINKNLNSAFITRVYKRDLAQLTAPVMSSCTRDKEENKQAGKRGTSHRGNPG